MKFSHDITAKGRAVEIGVAMRNGEMEAYTNRTPLTDLLAAESGGTSNPDTARGLLLRTIMAYLFGHGQHPANVMHRLFVLVREVAPELLKTLPPHEVIWLLSDLREAHAWRVGACLRGTRAHRRKVTRHDEIVHEALMAAHHRRLHDELSVIVELNDVLRCGENEMLTDYSERMKTIAAGLRFFFLEGPQPDRAVIRVFALAKAQFPALILHMNVRQLGALFGVTGAAWSERIKSKFNRFLDSRGAFGVKAPFQKPAMACESFSRAQRGNNNRRTGLRHSA